MKGRLWLIPVTLGGDNFKDVIPAKALEITRRLRYFIVEDLRSARRYLRLIDNQFPINDSVFLELNEHTSETETAHFLEPLLNGNDTGLMSEAGMPGIADPGTKVIAAAHREKIIVTPLSGPSSIIMALIASGMNGQNFSFNGYLPVKPAERSASLKELEKKAQLGYSQIFMETPYRNQSMLDSILAVCSKDTLLCIAAEISLPGESIRTKKISEWKSDIPDLKNKPVIFVLQ
ncbi:MAG: SAM-dependent methyltransferase [Bacteroidetes bacterium RBG_13_43_22]|nr:MAG: SAM-dependent methyltransferase [Bacteroidetes bacterium RBG_13_43_22]